MTSLTNSMVGLSSVDNTIDSAKPLSAAAITALALKLDRTQAVTSNAYFLNAGINTLSSVLSAIGSSTSVSVQCSAGGHSDSAVTISKVNLTMFGPDAAFSQPSVTFSFPVTISGASSTRNLFSNIQFAQNFVIDGTLG